MNMDGNITTIKENQKLWSDKIWFPLSNKYTFLTLEENENKTNEREARTKANHKSNNVEAINDMQ